MDTPSEKPIFNIYPAENYIDMNLYQSGWEPCEPGHCFGPVKRNHFLFHYVLSGTGILYSDDTKGHTNVFQVKSGQGFFLFPGQINTYVADAVSPWEYAWVEFDGLRVKEALDRMVISQDAPVYRSTFSALRQSMEDELLRIVHSQGESSLHRMGLFYLFLDDLVHSCQKPEIKSMGKMSDYYIKEAITYVEENFQNNISVEDIAHVCGIDRSYFGKIFHQAVGKSPQDFLIQYRMVKATELLKLTPLSVSDVSCAVGYDDPLHFSRAFKKIYGVSPRGWRQTNK